MAENFIGQWLELRQIDFTQPDKKLYPEFDDILKAAMLGETKAFFAQLLRDDLELTQSHPLRLSDAQPLPGRTLRDRRRDAERSFAACRCLRGVIAAAC